MNVTTPIMLPAGTHVCTSALTLLLSILMLNGYFCCSPTVGYHAVRALSSRRERLLVIVHYLIALPLFEVFVMWGPQLGVGVLPNSATSVVLWLTTLALSIALLVFGFWESRAHLWALQLAQVFQLPAALNIAVDRSLRHVAGAEMLFVGALVVIVGAEMLARATPVRAMLSKQLEQRILRAARARRRADDEDAFADDSAQPVNASELRSVQRVRDRYMASTPLQYDEAVGKDVVESARASHHDDTIRRFLRDLAELDPKDANSVAIMQQEAETLRKTPLSESYSGSNMSLTPRGAGESESF